MLFRSNPGFDSSAGIWNTTLEFASWQFSLLTGIPHWNLRVDSSACELEYQVGILVLTVQRVNWDTPLEFDSLPCHIQCDVVICIQTRTSMWIFKLEYNRNKVLCIN